MSLGADNNGLLHAPDITISMEDYWKNTISVCETALSMLLPFERRNHILVDAVTKPLRQLVDEGKDLAFIKPYVPPESPEASQQPWTNKSRKTITLDFDPREHWDIADTCTVYARLTDKTRITCKAVTTIKQLDEAVEILKKSKHIAIDCEFLGLKNSSPELKVLQLAVSSELGFAILVDQVGVRNCHSRLAPILESSERLLIGWAFRADAQAIEDAFKGIQIGPVLDLQEKLRPIAVEQLNLATAMARYAKDWSGLKEFSRAKQLGDTFHYSRHHCVWTKNPLPAEALVYAVFDVVSLIALQQRTQHYPTTPQHYWPQTLISSLGHKALLRWCRDRVANGLPVSQENVIPTDSSRKKGKKKSEIVPTTMSNADSQDEESRFAADIEEAIRRSKEDLFAKPTGEDRIIAQDDVVNVFDSSFSSSVTVEATAVTTAVGSKTGPAAIAESSLDSLNARRTITDTEKVDYGFQSTIATAEELTFADDIYDDKSKKTKIGKIPEGTWDAPVNDHKEWKINDRETDAVASAPEASSSKSPSQQLRSVAQVMREHAGGEFAYVPEPEVQNWNTLAKESIKTWDEGTDMSVDWEAIGSNNQVADAATSWSAPEVPHMKSMKFHTSIHERRLGNWGHPKHGEDSWTKEEAQPTEMKMPLKGLPKIKHKARGPRVVDPLDDGLYSDSDESSNKWDSDEDSTSDLHGQKGSSCIEETYRDDMFLDGDATIQVHLIKDASQLPTIPIPSRDEQLTAAVTFQVHMVYDREDVPRFSLKTLQIYLSTGCSYSLLANRVYRRGDNIESSAIGYILTSPNVRRVTWGYHFVAHLAEELFGFKIGPMIDLGVWMNDKSTRDICFYDAVQQELKVEADKQLYLQLMKETEELQASKFSSSIWDQERTSETAINFSALQGYILYEIFLSVNSKSPHQANNYIWPSSAFDYQLELGP